MQQAASKPVNNQVNSGWGSGGLASGGSVDEDDGGWGVGPPGVGSGWMGKFPIPPLYSCGLSSSSSDMNSWSGPAGDWKPNVIVDRNDKEAWPSIGGDNSETTSDNGDDSASIKSGSVISSSSQDHTALWGNALNGLESNTWETNPSNSSWVSSYPQSLSNNMQGITSIAGSSDPSRGWGNVPGSLPQGLSQIQGGNRPQNSVQIQQSAAESMQSSHSVSNQASYGAYTSAFKPVGDSWGPVGTQPSDVAGKGNGNSAQQKQEQIPEVGWHGNPPTSNVTGGTSDWGDATPSSMAPTKQQRPTESKQGLQPQPTSWAQAAGKGLSTSPSNLVSNQNAQSQSISQSEVVSEYRRVIDSHDGWGQKPIRQDTVWELETTPKTKRKFPATGQSADPEKPAATANSNNNNSNMWNNNNGTGIWESTKEPPPTSSWTSAPGGNSSQWEDPQPKDPNTWTNPSGTTSSQWGGKTETGSWPSENASQWGETGKQEVNDGTALWGNPGGKPANWNQPPTNAPPQRPNWNQAPPPTQTPAGWGQPTGPPPSKVDDGTCLWAAGSPKQAQAAGWGETNNQWNPAIGQKPKPASWSEDPSIKGASRFPGGNQPQMRSRMIQQLMELGFQKDEAQQALITNNMNYQSALADLYKQKGATYNRDDVLMESAKSKVIISDNDISDTQQENNPFVPTPNTPFPPPNAQGFKGPSQPVSSQTSIMPPQQNKKPAAGHGGVNQAQQMAQQQILQQLHLAVKAGLISPYLLNRHLPPHMLVLIQQLLQHQQCLQQLINTQQILQKNALGSGTNPLVQRQQLEQVNLKINTIKNQILHFQRQIHDAQRLLIKPQPTTTQSSEDPISSIQSELSNLNITATQPQSKLSQWKKPTEKESSPDPGANTENSALNKAPGSSKTSQPSSQSSLQYGGLGLTQLAGDPTWSNVPITTSSSQNWPTISGNSTGTTSTNDENGIKESHLATTSSSSLTINDAIPEFVPGKPWPGITQKSVEDDPHITPGSFSRSLSLSVSTVKDDYLGTLTKTSPNESLSWSANSRNLSQKWSGGDSMTPTSFSNEVWGVPLPKNSAMQHHSRPPPGLQPQKMSNWSGVNRQHSWAGTRTDPSTFNSGNMSNWDSRMSNNVTPCLILKNLTPQIDGSTLRTLCMQHGPLMWFYLSLNNGQALVRYHSKEEAFKAQKSLNTCVLGNTTIVAEFVSDNEAARFAMAAQSSQWQSQPNNSVYRQSSMGLCNDTWNQPAQANNVANNYNSGGMWGGGGGSGLWGGGDDHNANTLLGNIMGESM